MTPEDSTPVTPAMARQHDIERDEQQQRDELDGSSARSQAGSSFADPQTSAGGADAVPSTPDSTPRDNHRDNADLSDDDLLA